MAEKRTEQLNIRVTPEMKKILQSEAEKLDWSATKLAEKILKEWTEGTRQNKTSAMQFIINHNENINVGR